VPHGPQCGQSIRKAIEQLVLGIIDGSHPAAFAKSVSANAAYASV
jgi:hypothetical protein